MVPFVAKGGPFLLAKDGILLMAEIGILYLTIYKQDARPRNERERSSARKPRQGKLVSVKWQKLLREHLAVQIMRSDFERNTKFGIGDVVKSKKPNGIGVVDDVYFDRKDTIYLVFFDSGIIDQVPERNLKAYTKPEPSAETILKRFKNNRGEF